MILLSLSACNRKRYLGTMAVTAFSNSGNANNSSNTGTTNNDNANNDNNSNNSASDTSDLRFDPRTVTFASVQTGGSITVSVRLKNEDGVFDFSSITPANNRIRLNGGSGGCTLPSIENPTTYQRTFAPDYPAPARPLRLGKGEECTVLVTWSPLDTAPLNSTTGYIDFRSVAGKVYRLNLAGSASSPPPQPPPKPVTFTPNVIDYGNNPAGSVVSRTVTVKNVTTGPLQFQFAQTSDGRFNVTGGTCVNGTVISYGSVLYAPFYPGNTVAFNLAAGSECTFVIAANVYKGNFADEGTSFSVGITGQGQQGLAMIGTGY